MIDDMFRDAQESAAPTDEALRRVAVLAERQVSLEKQCEDLKKELEEKSSLLTQVRTRDLPDLMQELGLSGFKLRDGSEIKIKFEYAAHIKNELRDRAHAWLRENNFGDIIKNNLTISLGKGEDEKASQIEQLCHEIDASYERKEQVHPMTLKAFVTEQLNSNTALPVDLFGVVPLTIAKITPPRENKRRK